MHDKNLERWQHPHHFEQHRKRQAERRTFTVIGLTATMMVVEIAAGLAFASMALLADGLHMASHAVALSIAAFAYVYVRRHAHDPQFSFGTGKVNALGGFTGALLLAIFALLMAGESLNRLVHPVSIAFNQAISVAILGLMVNGASMLILGQHDHHGEHHEDAHEHEGAHHPHGDHNLRSAYLHVLADALTSLLAIFALLAAKYLRMIWMDPLMGIVGAVMVARWSIGLLRLTSAVLLDRQAPEQVRAIMQASIERHGDHRVADLHVWSVGPDIYAAILSVVSRAPQPPEWYRAALPGELGLVHVTVEVHHCPDAETQ
jgi:cation diffusion facilitator family transporter